MSPKYHQRTQKRRKYSFLSSVDPVNGRIRLPSIWMNWNGVFNLCSTQVWISKNGVLMLMNPSPLTWGDTHLPFVVEDGMTYHAFYQLHLYGCRTMGKVFWHLFTAPSGGILYRVENDWLLWWHSLRCGIPLGVKSSINFVNVLTMYPDAPKTWCILFLLTGINIF